MSKKSKIAISIDKAIDDKMDQQSVNKSKLINKLLTEFLDNEENIKKFKNKV